jgi:hypothetical protein
VLQYSSELIAQQLCLIEREMLSQVQWYELVDAGWTKKKASSAKPSMASSVASSLKEPASKGSRSSVVSSIQINEASLMATAEAGIGGGGEVGTNEPDSVNRSEGTVTPTPRAGNVDTAGPVKSSSKAAEDSLGIKRLVDRFNLVCLCLCSAENAPGYEAALVHS